MRVANAGVRIKEGREQESGHVHLKHGTVYTVGLQNCCNNRRCDAAVTIDGKDMGTFRLAAGGQMTLERPSHDVGCFTFYKADSPEFAAAACGDVAADDRGLVRVVFRYEKPPARRLGGRVSVPHDAFDRQGSHLYRRGLEEKTSGGIEIPMSFADGGQAKSCARQGGAGGQSVTAGATGLSGESKQRFIDVPELDYDPDETVTINLRLVALADGPRPLTSAPKANPVPAPVG